MSSIPPRSIKTDRLFLRPTRGPDADRAFEIQGDWEVTRMLSMASFPPDRQEIGLWFADHEREWLAGEAYRFAVDLEGRMVGMVDIDGIAEREGTFGYWLDRTTWGRGYAFEAAHAVTRFAFEDLGLTHLKAGHAYDNPASGQVLAKLGFNPLDTVQLSSRPRGEKITQRRYMLTSSALGLMDLSESWEAHASQWIEWGARGWAR
jgi:ribosomal-protein-alanine N-acetyltransferase